MIPPMPDNMIAFGIVAVVTGLVVAAVHARLSSLERRLDRIVRLEAKVDALLKHAGVDFDPYRDVPPDVSDALARGQVIEAIRRYREATGAGLKDAKDFVDEIRRRGAAPIPRTSERG